MDDNQVGQRVDRHKAKNNHKAEKTENRGKCSS